MLPKIIAIIPARIGSKRVPNKNFRPFGGKPLLIHSIEHALGSNRIDQIVVTSNHPKPEDIIPEAMLPFFVKRPEAISHSTAKGFTYVEHALNYLKETQNQAFSHFVVLPPTGPLRTSADIDQCLDKLLQTNCDTVVSVVKVNHMYHAIKQKTLTPDNRVQAFLVEEEGRTAYQEMPEVYVRNCAIYASKVDVIKEQSLIGKDCRAYIMPPERSVDINDLIDFEFGEFLYLKQQHN